MHETDTIYYSFWLILIQYDIKYFMKIHNAQKLSFVIYNTGLPLMCCFSFN